MSTCCETELWELEETLAGFRRGCLTLADTGTKRF